MQLNPENLVQVSLPCTSSVPSYASFYFACREVWTRLDGECLSPINSLDCIKPAMLIETSLLCYRLRF